MQTNGETIIFPSVENYLSVDAASNHICLFCSHIISESPYRTGMSNLWPVVRMHHALAMLTPILVKGGKVIIRHVMTVCHRKFDIPAIGHG